MSEPVRRFTFSRACRLSGRRAFAAVFDARGRRNVGPLGVCSRPNELAYCRLGLSVSRKVGNAVVRNRIKRLLREAFRLSRHDWPIGYDLVIIVRPHPPMKLEDYRSLLDQAVHSIDQLWHQRRRKQAEREP